MPAAAGICLLHTQNAKNSQALVASGAAGTGGVLLGGAGDQRQRMDPFAQFLGEDVVDHALALDAGLACEGRRHDFYAEVAFTQRVGAGVAGMAGGFVDDVQPRGGQGVNEFTFHASANLHRRVSVPFQSAPPAGLPAALRAIIVSRTMKRSSNAAWSRAPQADAPTRACDHPGCQGGGEYRAPRSRDQLDSYYWFCLEHVRAYNAAWDYYAGMSTEEIESMLRQDVIWQRPTWPLGARVAGRSFRIGPEGIRDTFGLFGDEQEEAERERQRRRPNSPEEKAMKVLELQGPITVTQLKARYKELVKVHHPDANGGDKAAEERFKVINQAYKTLLNSLNA